MLAIIAATHDDTSRKFRTIFPSNNAAGLQLRKGYLRMTSGSIGAELSLRDFNFAGSYLVPNSANGE